MSWTDDRIEVLAKLWREGLSASQIAAQLGNVTRNAVIGKIHRLGLSSRDKPASKGGGRRKNTSSTSNVLNASNNNKYTRTNRTTAKTAKTNNQSEIIKITPRIDSNTENLTAPKPKELKLTELTETTCKWPLGDPQNDDFCFCGHSAKSDTPYCEYHSKIAYQTIIERRAVNKVIKFNK